MKLVTFVRQGREAVGTLTADGTQVVPLERWPGMLELIADWGQNGAQVLPGLELSGKGIPLDQVRLAAPIPHLRHDMICIGMNYLEHAIESARFKGVEYKKASVPVYFSKRVNRAVGHDEPVPAHSDITAKLDYESELGVIIGKTCNHVPQEKVFDYIFGYTIVNDVSARDLQNAHSQFYFGKGLDGFTPMGPCIVTADELPAPPHLAIRSRVNGELRQDSNTSDLIFDIPYLVSQLSQGMALEPGDIIATGTPSGVGMGFTPPKFLSPGDVVECEIEGIGVLRNPIQV